MFYIFHREYEVQGVERSRKRLELQQGQGTQIPVRSLCGPVGCFGYGRRIMRLLPGVFNVVFKKPVFYNEQINFRSIRKKREKKSN